MLTPRRGRLSSAHLIALIALFIALGGTTWAAVQLGKGTVKAKNLAKNAVTTKKIKDGAVTAPKIADGAVSASKLAADAVGPRAYAKVNLDGSLVAGASRGVNGVVTAGVNGAEYCFDLTFTATTGIATHRLDTQPPEAHAEVQVPGSGFPSNCPAGFQDADVQINNVNGTLAPGGFFAWFN
jgi:hypothetical protein